jgi:uncharacterized protein (TIGR02145 family)
MKINTARFVTSIMIFSIISMVSGCKKDQEGIRDADGNLYHSVTIGTQTWLVENLRTTKYRNGDDILKPLTDWSYLTEGAWCKYLDSDSIAAIHGFLYNQNAIKDTRNICPKGWRVPTDDDWDTLAVYLQNHGYNADYSIDTDNDYRTNNVIAKAMASESGWDVSTQPMTPGNDDLQDFQNKSGFNALPAGVRGISGAFANIGISAFFWSSTKTIIGYRFVTIENNKTELTFSSAFPEPGMSVRCIKE